MGLAKTTPIWLVGGSATSIWPGGDSATPLVVWPPPKLALGVAKAKMGVAF
jgi:hypothetical protein